MREGKEANSFLPNLGQFGVEKDLLSLMSCACSEGNTECRQQLTSLSGSTIGLVRYP